MADGTATWPRLMNQVRLRCLLQEFRGEGLISLKGSTLTALAREELKKASDFDPAYLHLEDQSAAA